MSHILVSFCSHHAFRGALSGPISSSMGMPIYCVLKTFELYYLDFVLPATWCFLPLVYTSLKGVALEQHSEATLTPRVIHMFECVCTWWMGLLLLVSKADTLSMSPYSSVVAHTCACILWAFGKPHGLLVGLVLSSSSEPSLTLSTDSPLNTWATHCLRFVLRMVNVWLLLVGSALSWVHAVLCQLEGCHVLFE